MALPTTRDNPAPPSRNDVPASSLGGKVDDARNGVLSILKGTNWPRKARRDVQDLIQMVETKLNPDHIPTDDTQMPEDLRDAIEKLHMELERVHEKLKGESTKYDTTMKRLLRKLKKLFSRMNRSDCIDVLKQCQEDVDANLKILNNKLGSLEIKSDQRTSQEVQLDSKKNAGLIAEGSVGDDLGRLSGTPIASPTAPPAPNAVLETPKTSAPSNIPSGQPTSAPADIQPASVAAGKQEESSPHVNLLKGAKMTDIKSEQRTSQDVGLDSEKNAGVIAEGSGGDDSGRLPDTPIAPPTATPAPDAGSEAPKNSAASNIPADQPLSVPTGIQPASVAAEKQKESSPRANLLKIAKTTFKAAEGISGTLPVVGGYLGVVAKVGSTVVDMVQTMDDNDETGEKLVARVSKLSEVLERASNSARQPEESQTTKDVEALRQELVSVKHEVETLKSQPSLKKFWNSSDQSGSLKSLQEKVRTALEEIQLLINLNTSILVDELHNESIQNKHRHLLGCLGDGKYGARGNAIEDVTCLPGTRVEILERIDDWFRSAGNSERVLWIRGMAGRGKSAIASTVAQRWKDRACCATYYFRRGQNPSNSPLVCSLAKQLGCSLDPELRKAILSTVEKDENISNHRLDQQFAALFVSSLAPLKQTVSPILIIVDALDECDPVDGAVDDAVRFVKLIDQHSSSLPENLKFLLTSRPEALLLRALEPKEWQVESLDTIADVDTDLELFMRHVFSEVKKEHGIEGEWPAPDDITRLVSMSQGLFQWARTVVKYIGEGYALDRLSEILESPKAWDGVDELYHQILSKALEGVKPKWGKRNLLRDLLGTLVTAPSPVSLEVVAFLHAEHESLEGKTQETVINILRQEILVGLNSLLLIPASPVEPIRLMHTSIRDLLVDRERSGDRPYRVDLEKNHQRLASACIRQMNQHLRENVCNLSDLSKPSSEVQDIVERDLSKGIQYCCRSWSLYLTEGKRWSEPGTDGVDRQADFELFSKEKVLFWLEVMSLLGATNEAVSMAKQVYMWLSQRFNAISKSSSIVVLWSDVQRFVGAFWEPISFGPLHIYASALAHCPLETELWRCYSRFAKVRTIRGLQALTWPPSLWTRPTDSEVWSVAFSPDGALIAFGSKDGTICLCDAQTWRLVGEPLTGHIDDVNSVCFSPDGKFLASGSSDRTIRLWDPQTGKQCGEPLTGHAGGVRSVCFSPDGKLLASGCYGKAIRLWDPQTGKQVGEPLAGHTSWVNSVCFSPDGKLLASGSDDQTIRLWDPQTGKQFGEPLRGHGHHVGCICFSPDGKLLASGSWDYTIRLWDPQTGKQFGEPLRGHDRQVHSVCFSPDSKLLASASRYYEQEIRLWDPQTGKQVGEPLTGHTNNINSVCFSPDGKLLASGSKDQTIRVWDPHTGKQFSEPLTGHKLQIKSVYFSPDGKVLASGCIQETIRLWDLQTGKQVGEPLETRNYHLDSACFSPDSKILASGSRDRTVGLWDPQTGKQVGEPLAGHTGSVEYVRFSPDGKLLASGSGDRTVRLWDPQTGKQVGEPLRGHTGLVRSVCFSPDSKLLASGSEDGTIRLWDPQTGKQSGEPLTGHQQWVYSVRFSPDGKLLASFDSWTIRLWHPQTGKPVGEPLTDHTDVSFVCFSPDSKLLASASEDKKRSGYFYPGDIRIWDLQTGRQVGKPLKRYNQVVLYSPQSFWDTLVFEPDAPSHVTSASGEHHWMTLSSSCFFWLPPQYWNRSPTIVMLSRGKLAVIVWESVYIFDVSSLLELTMDSLRNS